MLLYERRQHDDKQLFASKKKRKTRGAPSRVSDKIPRRDPSQFFNNSPYDIPTEELGKVTGGLPRILIDRYPNKEPIKSPVFRDIIKDPSGFPKAMPIGDRSGITSDNPKKYPYQVPIIKPPSATIETPTKYPYHVPNQL